MVSDVMEVASSQFTEEGREYRIAYFLTEGRCLTDGVGMAGQAGELRGRNAAAGADDIPVYGVMTKLRVDGVPADSARVDDISPSKETVFNLIRLLARGKVTPVCLRDVAEDFVAAL